MIIIQSPDNPKFKKFKSLLSSKGIKQEGLCLVSGKKIIAELEDHKPLFEIIHPGLIAVTKAELVVISPSLFAQLDVLGTDFNLVVVGVPLYEVWQGSASSKAASELEVLVPLQDPSNLGSLVRSCEAFGVRQIVLLKESANPYLPKSIKASGGSVFRCQFLQGPSIQEITDPVVALDLKGKDIRSFDWSKHRQFLVGEEGKGIPPHLNNVERVRIPMGGRLESLNAVVAASIALWDFKNKKSRSSEIE